LWAKAIKQAAVRGSGQLKRKSYKNPPFPVREKLELQKRTQNKGWRGN
jgi:hypothetical protein